MKRNKKLLALGMVFSISVFMLTGFTSSRLASTASTVVTSNQVLSGNDSDKDGIPDNAEKLLGTNPHSADTDGDGQNDKIDKNPAFAANPMKETSKRILAVKVKDVRVEDNSTTDHLEITLINTGKVTFKSFDIYYTITDKLDKTKEAYYQKLKGLSIKPGETKVIHFDNKVSLVGHYFGNMNGLYGTSKNGLTFDISLHNTGFKPLSFKAIKAKGTAEVAD